MSALKDTSMNTNMHAAFKREIARLKRGLTTIDLTNAAAVDGLKQRYNFFSQTLHHHHEGEDTFLFERSKQRATPQDVEVLDALEAEHQRMLTVLNPLDASFGQLGTDSDKDALAAQLDELLALLTGHCAHEEDAGMAIVQKYVNQDDVKEFMEFARSGETSSLTLPWVCDGADAEVAAETWGMIPAVPRAMVRPMLTRKYNKFSKACGV